VGSLRMILAGGCAVEAHGVGEERFEDFVVTGCDELEDGGESIARGLGEVPEVCDRVAREQEELKGPDGPERDEGNPMAVRGDNAFALDQLEGKVVREEGAAVLIEVTGLRSALCCGLVGDVFGGPDLAVRVGIARAHHGSPILEYLDIADAWAGTELAFLRGSDVDDAANGGELHGGQGEIVAGIEAEDAANALFGGSLHEASASKVQS